MLNVRIGQLTFGDFHPIRSVALPAAPKALEVFPACLLNATGKLRNCLRILLNPF
jgi:hypothetical protein